MNQAKTFAPLVLRIGLSLIFLWFGSQQLIDVTGWVNLLPSWTSNLPISVTTVIHLNGWFEIIFGALLLVGFYTRIVALLLTLHLFGIVLTVGYNDIGVRDFGLATSTLAVFLFGPTRWSVDNLFARHDLTTSSE